jgi:hypothetical protein
MANPHPVSRKSKPNKASSARIERAIEQGKRLPPEDLLLAAEIYAGMAARFQPMNTNPDTGAKTPNKDFKEDRYAFWLGRWGDALAKAAPYYEHRPRHRRENSEQEAQLTEAPIRFRDTTGRKAPRSHYGGRTCAQICRGYPD